MPFKYLFSKGKQLQSLTDATIQSLTNVTESIITYTWKEIASLLGLQDDIYKNPLHKPLENKYLNGITWISNSTQISGNIFFNAVFSICINKQKTFVKKRLNHI